MSGNPAVQQLWRIGPQHPDVSHRQAVQHLRELSARPSYLSPAIAPHELEQRAIHRQLILGDEVVPDVEVVELSFAHHADRLGEDEVRRVPEVLDVIRANLAPFGWKLALGPRSSAGIPVQVAPTGRLRVDGFHSGAGAALWVETGRSWTNNAFLLHMVEAAMCPGIEHVVIAVRHTYNGQSAFDRCVEFAEMLVRSGRLELPYSSLLMIGF